MDPRKMKLKAMQEKARRINIPFVDLEDYELYEELIEKIPFRIARQHKLVALKTQEEAEKGELLVAMENPLDLFVIEQLQALTGMKIKPALAGEDDILNALGKLYKNVTPEDIQVSVMEDPDFVQSMKILDKQTVDWFKNVVENAVNRHASDVHIEPYQKELKVRYRIDGVIAESTSLPREMGKPISNLIKTLAKMKLEKRSIPQEGSIDLKIREHDMKLRASCIPTLFGERFTLRLINSRQLQFDIDRLGLTQENLQQLMELSSHKQGLLVFSGPSGSGLSTTMYSTLLSIAKPEVVIFTMEDPVEAPLPGVNQVMIRSTMETDALEFLDAIKKHSPDVIMVDQVRNPKIAKEVVEAALTGQLVCLGLYGRNSVNAISRLIDFGIETYFISTILLGVVSQRLARLICPHCSHDVPLEPELKWEFEENHIPTPYITRKGKGCKYCLNTGYKGRIGIYEILPINDSFRILILKGATKVQMEEQEKREGVRTLYQDGLAKVAQGLTTFDEIKRVLMD